MNENNETIITTPTEPDTNNSQQYIDAIRDLQKNSVSRDKYNKLEAENKQLLDTLVNGGTIEQVNVEPELSIEELSKNFLTADKTKIHSYDGFKNLLELRDKILAESGDDIFAKDNSYNERVKAERTAASIQQCIDDSRGDKDVFMREFNDRLIETTSPMAINTNNKRRF